MMVPGFKGLNKQMASGTLGPEWATVLSNAVVDDNGRVAARKGWENVVTTSIASRFLHVAEFVKSDGTTELVGLTADEFIFRSVDGGSTWAIPAGTVTVGDAEDAMFQNFNNKLWLFSAGQKPISYDGTTLVQVTDANAPTSGIGLAAFGRLWSPASDGHTLKYSALLDGTDWTSADDAGVADHWNVWPGNDQITAVEAFNGALVVFGKRSIVFWTDGQGSALGIDPLQMYVVDIVRGTGCISRHSIQHLNEGDMWFLSEFGLQSVGRLLQQKSNPIENLSKNVQDYLTQSVSAANMTYLRSAYSPKDKFFLLSLPSGGTSESGKCFVFDTRGQLEDGSARCLGLWSLVPTAPVVRRNGTLMFQIANSSAKLGTYSGGLDNGVPYVFDYESGWLDLTGEGYLLFPKRFSGVFYSDNAINVTFKWAMDFALTSRSQTRQFAGQAGVGAEWGLGEWGLGEFGGGVNLRDGHVHGSGSGEYIKLGISANINNTVLAVQQLDIFAKIGRYA
jgi:hypothetical protein